MLGEPAALLTPRFRVGRVENGVYAALYAPELAGYCGRKIGVFLLE